MTGPRRFAVLVVLAALLAAACSGGGDGTDTPTPGKTDGAGSNPTETVTAPPGTGVYQYANAGLTAILDLDGNTGTLEIVNETGRELPRPDLYVLDARDGTRIEGKVIDPAPVPDKSTATFDVSFPPVLEVKNVGLVVLLMGGDNYGAFVRQ
jgi:hypothetical protein